jgi:hypothetical protein
MSPTRYSPKKIIIVPPIYESHVVTPYATCSRSVFSSTPSAANIVEKPMTKKRLLRNISKRCFAASTKDVPARYARNPGMIGSTQGERNETSPAKNANGIEISVIGGKIYTYALQ